MKKKKINKTNVILSILLVLSASVFIYSLLNIRNWKKDNDETEKEVESIYKTVSVEEVTEGENVNAEAQKKESIYWSYIKMNMINVDFTELLKQNSDTKGWIQVNGTNINYPFVQTNDNTYYLKKDFNKKYNSAGWIFMDYRNNISNFDKNTILYAHGRVDGTMFGSLKNITKSNWYSDKNNHVVKLSTEYENTLWQVFSIYRIPETSDYLDIDFSSDEKYEKFLSLLKSRSEYQFEVDLNKDDKILTLSTCYKESDRVVLHAKLIKMEVKNGNN